MYDVNIDNNKIYNSNDEFILEYLNFDIIQNKRILCRNSQDWYEFIDTFSIGELYHMRAFVCCHPSTSCYAYNFNNDDGVSNIVHDYIAWLVHDLIFDGQYREAKEVLNNGFVG